MRRDLLVFAALAVVAPVASAAASDFSKPRFVQTESAPERSIALLGKLDKAIAGRARRAARAGQGGRK